MNKNGSYELETFRKCIEARFGPNMERKILTNFYANYGDTKNIFEYMFNNIYSEKTVRLVKLNLEIDLNENEENQRKAEAKMKNIELKKELAKLKNKLEQEDSHATSLCHDIKEQENKLIKLENEWKNNEMTCMTQEVFTNKVQDVCNKFDSAVRNMNFLTPDNTNESINHEIKQSEIENLISKLKISNESDSKSISDFQTVTANKVNLVEITCYLKNKITEDSEKIEQITGRKYLQNEVDLLLYQLDSKLYNSTNTRKPDLNISERINETHLENIQRECEKRKWIKEKTQIAPEIKELKLKLNEYLMSNYKEAGLQLYAQYLGSHLTLKRIETEYNESKAVFNFLEAEIKNFEEIACSTVQKTRQLNNLMELINQKQLKLDKFLEENRHNLNSKLQLNICEIKSISELLLELINLFNTDQLNRTRADITLQSNMTNLNNSTNLVNSNGLIQLYNQLKSNCQIESIDQPDEFTHENKMIFKKLFNNAESKEGKELFDQLVHVFNKLKSNIYELDKLNRNQSRHNDIQHLAINLNDSLNKCQSIDDHELFKYVKLLTQNINKIKESSQQIPEIEKLIKIWQTQPGAYECTPDELTVNGKKLGYYFEILNRAIAQTERMTFAQSQQVNEQARHLLMYCSSLF